MGFLELPAKKLTNGGLPPNQHQLIEFSDELITSINELKFIPVNRQLSRIWNSCIAQFHYLGLPTPVGRLLRYLVYDGDCVLAAISFGEPAWHVSRRNELLKIAGMENHDILNQVVSNNRFLVLPNVKVKNLASQILSRSVNLVVQDWNASYNADIRIIETFVDPSRFHGTCYKAANWIWVGNTKGYSKRGASHERHDGPKMIFLKATKKKLNSKLIELIRADGQLQTNTSSTARVRKPRRTAA